MNQQNTDNVTQDVSMKQKIFLPYSETLLQEGQQPPGELVPYQLAYQCVRLLDGTYDEMGDCVASNPTPQSVEDDRLAPIEERAWSSPIFVNQPRTSVAAR